jgi:hypothetical protein
MQLVLIVLLAFHVVPGVFWAGTTFVLARTGGQGAEQLAYPQIGAATVSMLAGLALWGILHGGAFGRFQQVLAVGVVCAIAAAGVQSARGLPAVRRLLAGGGGMPRTSAPRSPTRNGSRAGFWSSRSLRW